MVRFHDRHRLEVAYRIEGRVTEQSASVLVVPLDVETVDDAAEEAAAACLKGRTLADEIAALAELTVEDANALMKTALREENRAYVQIDPQ